MPRETTLTRVDHPEFIRMDFLSGAAIDLTWFDHPALRPIINGSPALGWEGDNRLAFYYDGAENRIALFRLEEDGGYRPVVVLPDFAIPNEAQANRIITRLVATDQRRGVNVLETVAAANAAAEKAQRAAERDANEALADKLKFALKKDGA